MKNKNILSFIIKFIFSVFVYIFFTKSTFKTNICLQSIMFFFIILYCVCKLNLKYEKKSLNVFWAIFSVFISFLYFYGDFVINGGDGSLNFESVFEIIGYSSFIYLIIKIIFDVTNKYSFKEKAFKNNKLLFIFSLFLIFLSWVPYLLNYFPGIFSSDSIDQLYQALGIWDLNNHHPVFHTLFIKLFYNLGSLFFKNSLYKIMTVTVAQMLICSAIYSYFIVYLNKNFPNKIVTIAVLFYFMFNPVIALYSITAWKDVLFGTFVLLLVIRLYDIFILKNENIGNYVSLFIILILVALFRNNAIYMIFILLFCLILFSKNKITWFLTIGVIVLYYVITGPIFNLFSIGSTELTESLGIPLQQMARVVIEDGKISDSQVEYIDSIIDIDTLEDVYNPLTVDSIKFNEDYDGSIISDNLLLFIKNWLILGLENPSIYIESYAYSTLGFWLPSLNATYVNFETYENDIFNTVDKLDDKYDVYFDFMFDKESSLTSINWSIGTIVFLLFISFIISVLKNGKEYVLVYTPLIGLWLTIMIATPVYCDIRYVYYLYCLLPFIFIIPFSNMKNCNSDTFFDKIIKLIKKYRELIVYIIVGLLTTFVSLFIYFLCVNTILDSSVPIQLQISNILSWIGAVIFAYFANRVFVFKSKSKNKIKEFGSFVSSRILTLLMDMLVTFIFVTLMKQNDIIGKCISQVVVTIGNYVLAKLFVFKKEK